MDEHQLETTTDRHEVMTNTTRTTADIRQTQQQLRTGDPRPHKASDFLLLLIMVTYHENDSNLLVCTSTDACCEKIAILDQAAVIPGSRVHQPITTRAGEVARVNIVAVIVGQGVARLPHSSRPNVNIATAIVNTMKRRYVTDKTGGAAAQIGTEAGTETVVKPSTGSDLLDTPAGN